MPPAFPLNTKRDRSSVLKGDCGNILKGLKQSANGVGAFPRKMEADVSLAWFGVAFLDMKVSNPRMNLRPCVCRHLIATTPSVESIPENRQRTREPGLHLRNGLACKECVVRFDGHVDRPAA